MKFNDYYKRLEEYYWDNIPDYAYGNGWDGHYTIHYEQWGGLMWQELLWCGEIATYPKKMVEQYLKELGASNVEFKNVVPFEDDTNNTIDIWFEFPLNEEFIQKLKDVLFKLGWKIKEHKPNHIIIGPLFPIEYFPSNKDNFYYITYKEYEDVILEKGLPLKRTDNEVLSTIKHLFHHPIGRIYLCQVNNPDKMNEIVEDLANDDWVIENTIFIKIDISGMQIFEDPLFYPNDDYKMCFTPDLTHFLNKPK